MKAEFVLACKTSVLEANNLTGVDMPIYQCDFADVLPHLQHGVILGQREALEKDESARQFLPYVLLAKVVNGETKVFAYRRGKGVGESRLSGNVSIGIGGHIDMVDVVAEGSVVDTFKTVMKAMSREMSEEIILDKIGESLQMGSLGILLDNSNDVGKVHMGMVIVAQLPEEATAECREEELETLGFMTPRELLDSGLPLENWTRILCEHIIAG